MQDKIMAMGGREGIEVVVEAAGGSVVTEVCIRGSCL